MPILQVVQCDQCGDQKKKVNHWWVIATADPGKSAEPGWMVMPFREVDMKSKARISFYCGVNCALQSLQEKMTVHMQGPPV